MNKLSLLTLKERAESIASKDLLNTISGGTENSCHTVEMTPGPYVIKADNVRVGWGMGW